jgi:predicted TIM-barrel enzyme
MSPATTRKQILQNLRAQITNGNIIVGAGAGIGLSAKFIEEGGGDLIIVYNSGRFRMAGRGSLAGLMPYGNANDVVVEMVLSEFNSIKLPWVTTYIGERSPPRS